MLCSYYYDIETGWYYLQSRYYDPVIHRFINADNLASTGQGMIGYNMFAYCLNNPVMGADPKGNVPNINLMATDGGGGNGTNKRNLELYEEMQMYGFEKPVGKIRKIQATKEQHNRSSGEYRSEKIQKKLMETLFTFGQNYLSDGVGYVLGVLDLVSVEENILPPPMEYVSYTIYLEFDIEDATGITHCWDRRSYILVSQPNGIGKYLYLYDSEGGSFS